MTESIRIIPEDELVGVELVPPKGCDLYYIKLVGIGPQALKQNQDIPSNLLSTTRGFYLVAPTTDIETSLISIIQRAFAERRMQMEVKDGSA